MWWRGVVPCLYGGLYAACTCELPPLLPLRWGAPGRAGTLLSWAGQVGMLLRAGLRLGSDAELGWGTLRIVYVSKGYASNGYHDYLFSGCTWNSWGCTGGCSRLFVLSFPPSENMFEVMCFFLFVGCSVFVGTILGYLLIFCVGPTYCHPKRRPGEGDCGAKATCQTNVKSEAPH